MNCLYNLNYKYVFIIIIISIIVLGGSYLIWQKFFNKKKLEPFLIKSELQQEHIICPMSNNHESSLYLDISTNPYFDITMNDTYLGRVIFQLFDDDVPKTCKNFRYLCSNGILDKSKPSYQDTKFHRIIKEFMLQGGDFTNGDGTGGMSIYGDKFEDENFNLTHNQPGMLSMANAGPNTNNSQFFITVEKTPWLDNKHVVFGIIISGFDIIKKLEDIATDSNDKPVQNIYISKCGLLPSIST